MSIRFIAGAVCPKCGAMDTLMAGTEKGVMVRECVDCSYTDRISEGVNTPAEVSTRVTPKKSSAEVTATPVRILDPDSTEDTEH